jgi:hypothetical protein
MSVLSKIMRWFRRPAADPEAEAETHRIRAQMETIRASQSGASAASSSLPPTPDVTDPKP